MDSIYYDSLNEIETLMERTPPNNDAHRLFELFATVIKQQQLEIDDLKRYILQTQTVSSKNSSRIAEIQRALKL